ncbi:MAG: nucleobase:cation symporter-2 family protein [Clostridia bacterium]
MNKKHSSVYELEGRVPLKQAVPLGMQHVLAMFVGNVTPLLIISGMISMDATLKTALIQNSMFVAGLATLVQLYPIWKIGSGLPVVMGTSSGFLGTAKSSSVLFGYGSVLGASIIGALVEIIIGFFIKPIRKIFPPVVTGIVVLTIGISLIPIGINYFAGGSGAADFGSLENLFLGFLVMVLVLFFKQFFGGFISASSILIAITVGYIAAIFMGKVDFAPVADAAWFSLPTFMPVGLTFEIEAIIPMVIMFIATAVETIGDTSGIAIGGLGREATDKELSGSVILDGVSSMIAACFGVLPNTSFSQNVGLVAMTKVINKFAIMTGAMFLILSGFVPKLGAVVSAIPSSVLGGATVIMFAMIAVSGMQLLFSQDMTGRNGMIVAISLGLGLGLSGVPEALAELPSALQLIFSQDGIVIAFVVAVILNLALPKDKALAERETLRGN